MKMIYIPSGGALEYAPYAINIYKGCHHRCLYCYGPAALRKKKEDYFNNPDPKVNFIEHLREDARKMRANGIEDEILISFIGDPYQPVEMELGLTRRTIEILIENELRFTILTKGGTRAVRDFDLLENYPKCSYGTSLVFSQQQSADIWDTQAALIEDRIAAIQEAKSSGIRTWMSLEPVIIPEQAIELIQRLHPIIDHWKVGKINHCKAVESRVDWIQFREDVTSLLDSLEADFYIKDSLSTL
ncbi:radical SAM protein [candidate division KSB1 bacterium]